MTASQTTSQNIELGENLLTLTLDTKVPLTTELVIAILKGMVDDVTNLLKRRGMVLPGQLFIQTGWEEENRHLQIFKIVSPTNSTEEEVSNPGPHPTNGVDEFDVGIEVIKKQMNQPVTKIPLRTFEQIVETVSGTIFYCDKECHGHRINRNECNPAEDVATFNYMQWCWQCKKFHHTNLKPNYCTVGCPGDYLPHDINECSRVMLRDD